jgi:hypothetical protein
MKADTMSTVAPVAWMLRKVRHDPAAGERFVLMFMDRATAAEPFERWPGASTEIAADEARVTAARLGIKPEALADALARARQAFERSHEDSAGA